MSITLTIANQKGGVAKTTTTSIMAACLTRRGYRVLCIDLDPQGNLSLANKTQSSRHSGVRAVLSRSLDLLDAGSGEMNETTKDNIISGKHYDILPGGKELSAMRNEINDNAEVLKHAIVSGGITELYDFILIDTPPTFNGFVMAALLAADQVVIPMTADKFSVSGIKLLGDTIERIRRFERNPDLHVAGILRTRWDPRLRVSKRTDKLLQGAAEYLETKIYDTFIRNSVTVSEAVFMDANLLDYAEDSTVAKDYMNFVDEYLEGLKR